MRAVEISSYGAPEVLKITDIAAPTSLRDNEVLIDVKAAGINRPDVIQRLGMYPPPPGASPIPGLEVAGIVKAIGKNVSQWLIGDKVCALVTGGGYAEECIAPEETCLPIPSGFSFAEAAALPETFFTVWSNVFDRGVLQAGESFLVHGGSSGIGSVAIQLAKAFGASVYTTAGSDEKCTFCTGLGADLAINYKEKNFVDEILKATDGKGVDVVLDMVGGDYISQNINCMAMDGRHVSIAFLNGPMVELNMLPVMLKRLTLTGSTLRARDNTFKGAIAENLKSKVWPLLDAGKVKPQIHKIFPLADAAKAHKMMEESTHMGKIILAI